MIDERKLIEGIKKIEEKKRVQIEGVTVIWTTKSVIELLEKFPKIGEWIPCSERLPEEPEEIPTEEKFIEEMILDGKLKEYIVMIYGADEATTLYYTGNNEWYDAISSEYYRVVAWQPLPEPYIGEQHEG